ncbi:MAG: HAD family phosphatase [Clostridiales bacterium]
MKKKYKAVCFDMDGSFFQNTKSIDYLCILNKKEKELKDIEQKERENEITWIKSDYLRVKLLEGLLESKIKDFFNSEMKLNEGIEECVESIKEQNMKIFLITTGPSVIAKIISDKYKFDEYIGSDLELKEGKFTGDMKVHLNGENKLLRLKEFCKKNKIKMKDCIAVGDSISDMNIFDNCGKRIAINFSNALINISDEYIATNDLKDIIDFLK